MDKQQYDNERTGVMFLKGSENPKAPKWNGKMTLGGVAYQIAAWEKTSRSGKEMLTISISDEYRGADRPAGRGGYPPSVDKYNRDKANAYAPAEREDDIPF